MDVFKLPKSQLYVNPVAGVLVLVKLTVKVGHPEVGLASKFATCAKAFLSQKLASVMIKKINVVYFTINIILVSTLVL